MPIEQPNLESFNLSNEKPKQAEMICQHCKKLIGFSDSGKTSHGVCSECRTGGVAVELQELKEMVKEAIVNSVNVINDTSLANSEKVKLLENDRSLIENHSLLDLTEDNLEEIKTRLIAKFGL